MAEKAGTYLGLVSEGMLLGDHIRGNEVWLLSAPEGEPDQQSHLADTP